MNILVGGHGYDLSGVTESFVDAIGLPREFYLEPDLYGLEELRLMRAHWVPVARVEQVRGPGDYLTIELLGEPLLVVRGEGGAVRVLANVCRHRAMRLMTGQGTAQKLTCPYHLWTYRLDGSLSGAPMMAEVPDFDRAAVSLTEVNSEIWQGWVLVNLDGGCEPLAQQIHALSAELAGWGFGDMRLAASRSYECPWNWKIIVENFSEYYHHLGLHRDSLEPFLPARGGRCLDNRGEPWSSSVIRCSDSYLELQGEPMSGLDAEHAATMQIFTVFPLLCAGAQGSSGFWLCISPQGADRSLVTWHVLVRHDRDDIAEFAEASIAAIDVLQREDGLACEGVQAGLRSTFAKPGRFGQLEKPLWQFHRWIAAKLPDPVAAGSD